MKVYMLFQHFRGKMKIFLYLDGFAWILENLQPRSLSATNICILYFTWMLIHSNEVPFKELVKEDVSFLSYTSREV